jgi:DNA-binding XRE family transcriptional regulator
MPQVRSSLHRFWRLMAIGAASTPQKNEASAPGKGLAEDSTRKGRGAFLLIATEDVQVETFNYSKWTRCSRAFSLKGMTGELAQLKKKIGSRIRQRREDVRMSQEALAFDADLTPSYLCQIEAGKRNPSIGALYRLCAALRLDLSDLVKV